MNSTDTIKLLKECDAGTKMAVSSIDEVIDKVQNQEFKEMLIACKDQHTKIGNEIHTLLNNENEQDKDPNPIAKTMSFILYQSKKI